jgi:hypothetical protein
MVSEDGQCVCCHSSGSDMDDGWRQFSGKFEHVWQHQQQPLGGSEGGRKRTTDSCTMERSSGTTF